MNPVDFSLVNRLNRPGGQNHRHTAGTLDEFAEFEPGNLGHRNVGNDQIRLRVFQTQHRNLPIADSNDFVAFVAEYPLTHALSMRAVISQQDTAHCWAAAAGGTVVEGAAAGGVAAGAVTAGLAGVLELAFFAAAA